MADNSLFFNGLELPLTPTEFLVQGDAGNQQIQVINLGQINHLNAAANLNTITMTVLIPTFLGAESNTVDALDSMFQNHEVVRVILTGTSLNDQYTIEKFDKGFTNSDNSMWQVNMTLMQYRSYAPNVVVTQPQT